MKTITLTTKELYALAEYSCTVPTGTTIGKRWRCHRPYMRDHRKCDDRLPPCGHWFVGEYYDLNDPHNVGIRWYRVVVSDLPRLPFKQPTWSPEVD